MRYLNTKLILMSVVLMLSATAGFALPNCPSDQTERYHNCFGTSTYDNGDKYVGEWQDNQKHGQGTFVVGNLGSQGKFAGDKYVGQYKAGVWHGQGTYTHANGGKYVGEFKDGKKNGRGTFTFANGDKYVGEFEDGKKKNGRGTFTFASGNKYVGEFKDGKQNGQGTYTFENGNKYVGEFKDGNYNGQGTFTFANGSIPKEGIWKDGEFQYAQKLYSENSSSNFSSNLPQCPTSGYFFSESTGYIESCFGVYDFDDGAKYNGEWQKGMFNGQGTLTFADGDKYVGGWKDGVFHGHGSYIGTNSGGEYTGSYKNGEMHGKGSQTFYDTGTYVGDFKNNEWDGEGIFVGSGKFKGYIQEGIWKDGEFQYAQKLSPPVPELKTPTQDDELISASSGSGFAVSADGYVITNNHVIEGCQEVVVYIKGTAISVTVVTYDPQNDLALLKGDFRPSTVFPLTKSRPELLQDVYVAGFPFGTKVSTSVKVTKGIISSLTGMGNNFSNIQIDAALQSGNSGGPILDDLGNVVGVAVSKLDAKYMFDNFGSIPENTNFGIKSNVVRSIMDSNGVDSPPANRSAISKSQLGKMISDGTYYISCWMTMAQVAKLRSKKVMFEDLE